jgi:hypothetical protein
MTFMNQFVEDEKQHMRDFLAKISVSITVLLAGCDRYFDTVFLDSGEPVIVNVADIMTLYYVIFLLQHFILFFLLF